VHLAGDDESGRGRRGGVGGGRRIGERGRRGERREVPSSKIFFSHSPLPGYVW